MAWKKAHLNASVSCSQDHVHYKALTALQDAAFGVMEQSQ